MSLRWLAERVSSLALEFLFDAFEFLDQPGVALLAALLPDGEFHLPDLFVDEPMARVEGHRDLLEAGRG